MERTLEDDIVEYAAKNQRVTVFLMNGYQYNGFIKNVRSNGITIHADGKIHLVYYHAISTIDPN